MPGDGGATLRSVGAVDGWSAPGFDAVRLEFERNFSSRQEAGATVCVIVDGETVVDLWGGVADPATGRVWERDTLAMVWSATKGATALCAHLLIEGGELELDRPLAYYWPQFAAQGKDGITLRMVLNHQAGLPHVRAPLPDDAYCDWDGMVERIEAEAPFWVPGAQHGYHALTYGWLVGEVVRRVTGRTLGAFFADEVAGPLDLPFWIGLPPDREPSVAPSLRAAPPPAGEPTTRNVEMALRDPSSIPGLVFYNSGRFFSRCNTPEVWRAEIPGANGITNARGLAGMYAPLARGAKGEGRPLLSETAVARMSAVSSASGLDASLLLPTRFSLGFMKAWDNRDQPPGARDSFIVSEAAFGHVGFGGSVGFADPGARLAFGYVMNRHGSRITIDERAQSLIDATYRSLGYRTDEPGTWI